MAGAFNYNPGVSDRRGEILGLGINRASEALSAGIEAAAKQHKERKAYAQLAETLGLDPDKVTKEQVQAALLRNELMQAAQERQQQTRSRAALQSFFAGLMPQRQATTAPPTSAERAAAGILGVEPTGAPGTAGPGLTPGQQAVLESLRANPEMLNAPGGGATGQDIIRQLMLPGKTPTFGTTPGGRFMAVEPTGGVRFEPNPPARAAGSGAPPGLKGFSISPEPEDDLEPSGAPGLFRVMRKGKAVGWYQDPQSAPRAPLDPTQQLNEILNPRDPNKAMNLPDSADDLIDKQLYNTGSGPQRWHADKKYFLP